MSSFLHGGKPVTIHTTIRSESSFQPGKIHKAQTYYLGPDHYKVVLDVSLRETEEPYRVVMHSAGERLTVYSNLPGSEPFLHMEVGEFRNSLVYRHLVLGERGAVWMDSDPFTPLARLEVQKLASGEVRLQKKAQHGVDSFQYIESDRSGRILREVQAHRYQEPRDAAITSSRLTIEHTYGPGPTAEQVEYEPEVGMRLVSTQDQRLRNRVRATYKNSGPQWVRAVTVNTRRMNPHVDRDVVISELLFVDRDNF